MVSITSNPLSEPALGVAVFSTPVPSNSTDASHPCYRIVKQTCYFPRTKFSIYVTCMQILADDLYIYIYTVEGESERDDLH